MRFLFTSLRVIRVRVGLSPAHVESQELVFAGGARAGFFRVVVRSNASLRAGLADRVRGIGIGVEGRTSSELSEE